MGRLALPGPERGQRRLRARRRGGPSTTASSERPSRPDAAPAPAPGRSAGPGSGSETGRPRHPLGAAGGQARAPCRAQPPHPRDPARPPRRPLGPKRRPAPARQPGGSVRRRGNPPSSHDRVVRRGEALAWVTLRRRGRSLPPRGGRMPRAPVVPSPAAPSLSIDPYSRRPPPQTGRVPTSLPPPALPAPGAPRRATLRGREGAGGAGRAGTPGLSEVAEPPRRHRPRSPLTPAAAAVGDVARRGAAGVQLISDAAVCRRVLKRFIGWLLLNHA